MVGYIKPVSSQYLQCAIQYQCFVTYVTSLKSKIYEVMWVNLCRMQFTASCSYPKMFRLINSSTITLVLTNIMAKYCNAFLTKRPLLRHLLCWNTSILWPHFWYLHICNFTSFCCRKKTMIHICTLKSDGRCEAMDTVELLFLIGEPVAFVICFMYGETFVLFNAARPSLEKKCFLHWMWKLLHKCAYLYTCESAENWW